MTEVNDLARWWQLHAGDLDAVRARLWQLTGQLDGGLTAGQATSSWDVKVAFALKYEIKDGLLDQLEQFFHGPLADERAGPDGRAARESLIVLIAHLATNGIDVARRSYGDSGEVSQTLRMVRGAAKTLDNLAACAREAVLAALR